MPAERAAPPTLERIGEPAPGATGRGAAILLLLGVAFDLAFHEQRPGISILLCVMLAAVAVWYGGPRTPERAALLGAALVFALFPAVRASEGLIAMDLVLVVVLLCLAAGGGGAVAGAGAVALAARAMRVAGAAGRVPSLVLFPLMSRLEPRRLGRARRVLRAATFAAPVLALFAGLLAAADRVFAQIVFPGLPSWNAGRLFAHVALILTGTLLIGTLWAAAGRAGVPAPRSPTPAGPRGRAGLAFGEWAAVLGGIDALFAVFVVVQFAFLFGGRTRVEVTPGLTYAEYARTGFFQLLAVAGLTLLVLVAAWDFGRRDDPTQERWFRRLMTAMVVLSFVILASALMRLSLYEEAFGFTVNRLVAYAAILWIAAVLGMTGAILWTRRRDYLVFACVAAALAALLVVNVLNPDRFVADRNAERFRVTGKIDTEYLGSLGPDAIPVTAPLVRKLRGEQQRRLLGWLCGAALDLGPEPGWQSWNAGRSAARSALADAHISASRCHDILWGA